MKICIIIGFSLITLSITSGQNISKIDRLPYLVLVGNQKDTPIFSSFDNNLIYYYNDGFELFKKGPAGYTLVYINDSCEIYLPLERNSKELLVSKSDNEIILIELPDAPHWITASNDCDKLYFSAGDECDYINVYDVKQRNITRGVEAYYESFWYTDEGLIYFVPEYDQYGSLENNTLYIGNGINNSNSKNITEGRYSIFKKLDETYTLGIKMNFELNRKEWYLINNINSQTNKLQIPEEMLDYWSFICRNKLILFKPGNDSSVAEIELQKSKLINL